MSTKWPALASITWKMNEDPDEGGDTGSSGDNDPPPKPPKD